MELVYNGHDNVVKFQVLAYEGNVAVPVDFSGVTSMRLEIPSIPLDITSGIAWTNEGEITISGLGKLGLAVGRRTANLIVIDPEHPDGQVLVHSDSGDLVFKISE